MPLGIPPLLRVGELLCTDTKGTLKAFAETSPELRITPKTSVASDQVLITLAPRMLILCTGLKGKIGDNLSELSLLWSQHPDFGAKT